MPANFVLQGLGIVDVLVPVAILVASAILVLRLAATGDLKKGVLFIVLLPQRQRIILGWFLVMILLFIAGTVVEGLNLLSIILDEVADLGVAVADVGAASALLTLLLRGLSPRPLTEFVEASISAQPLLLAALGIQARPDLSDPVYAR
jgi:hypothetical protein